MSRNYIVYALVDPNTGEDRYVGTTGNSVEGRLINHMSRARCAARRVATKPMTSKNQWIASLLADGKEPAFRVLCVVHSDMDSYNAEREWTARLLKEGAPLTNIVNSPGCNIGGIWKEIATSDLARAPAGYVLPSAVEWHAATVRLIKAYRASLADPETGLRGAHECMREMGRMAGIEVAT